MDGINLKFEAEAARPQDLRAIQSLLKEENLPWNDLRESHLKSFLVIRDKDTIIAAIGAEIYKSYALLRSLVVKSEYRNQRIASRLLARLESRLIDQKIHLVYLLTTTAGNFFMKYGYKTINRRDVPQEIQTTEEFLVLCPQTALCMFKNLK